MTATVDDLANQGLIASLDGSERVQVTKQGYKETTTTGAIAALAGGAALNSITVALGAGPYTNASAANGLTSYVSGVTNRIRAAAASGGTTINSIDMSGASDNFEIFWENTSSTDYLYFTHLTGASGTQFSNNQGLEAAIPPLACARQRLSGGKCHLT